MFQEQISRVFRVDLLPDAVSMIFLVKTFSQNQGRRQKKRDEIKKPTNDARRPSVQVLQFLEEFAHERALFQGEVERLAAVFGDAVIIGERENRDGRREPPEKTRRRTFAKTRNPGLQLVSGSRSGALRSVGAEAAR